jgi:hypothetical protein
LTGGASYILKCTSQDAVLGGLSGYDPVTGRFTNSSADALAIQADVRLNTDQGNLDVDFRKFNGATDSSVWRSQFLGYTDTSMSQTVILQPSEYMYVQYSLDGPTGYNLYSTLTRQQFTKLAGGSGGGGGTGATGPTGPAGGGGGVGSLAETLSTIQVYDPNETGPPYIVTSGYPLFGGPSGTDLNVELPVYSLQRSTIAVHLSLSCKVPSGTATTVTAVAECCDTSSAPFSTAFAQSNPVTLFVTESVGSDIYLTVPIYIALTLGTHYGNFSGTDYKWLRITISSSSSFILILNTTVSCVFTSF